VQPVAITIAGSDPSGGAGIQADLKTFHQLGVFGEAAITLITVQNTLGVQRVEVLAADLVEAQVTSVIDDIPPQAGKTGALGSIDVVRAVGRLAATFRFPLVVDPVMISKHGAPLLSEEAGRVLLAELVPHAALLIPNLPEAAALTGRRVETIDEMKDAARFLSDAGAGAVLVKGGHCAEPTSTDVLFHDGAFSEFRRIAWKQITSRTCRSPAAPTARRSTL
jgi:hydroxymethylpyrimidine kinase/phosphomethylpyrimidine kinase